MDKGLKTAQLPQRAFTRPQAGCRALPQLLNKIARPALATFFDTDFLQCQCMCVRVCVKAATTCSLRDPRASRLGADLQRTPPWLPRGPADALQMTGTREYKLFTQGPTVNYLLLGDPQLCYGYPGTPSDRTRRHPACACCSLHPHTPLPRPHPIPIPPVPTPLRHPTALPRPLLPS